MDSVFCVCGNSNNSMRKSIEFTSLILYCLILLQNIRILCTCFHKWRCEKNEKCNQKIISNQNKEWPTWNRYHTTIISSYIHKCMAFNWKWQRKNTHSHITQRDRQTDIVQYNSRNEEWIETWNENRIHIAWNNCMHCNALHYSKWYTENVYCFRCFNV